MFILVNPEAGGGTALERWREIEPEVRRRVGPFRVAVAAGSVVMTRVVLRELARGETDFVAAGGDGTVNLLASVLMENAPPDRRDRIRLGAVGLGSSNDFHKPFRERRTIRGIAVRLDFDHLEPSDVCTLDYAEPFLAAPRRCEWLVNASIGTTADANRRFNAPDRILTYLKARLPTAGMVYAAVAALLNSRSRVMEIRVDGGPALRTRVRNVGIVKNPNFSGSLSYGTPIEPTDGSFYVHIIGAVGPIRLIWILGHLLRGRFGGRGTRTWRAHRLEVHAEKPFAVERDGQVVRTRDAVFGVLPEAIQLCG
jgi:diacylglycerol kinase family enzyme